MKKTLLAGIAVLLVATSAAHATEYQGKLPTPVQRLPKYPPVVCVAPNWATEPCENRQSKSRLSESEPKMQRVGVALEYPKELPDNAPGWFSRKDWISPIQDLKKILEEHERCKASEATKKVSNSDLDFSWLPCLVISLNLVPLWFNHIDKPVQVAVEWPLPPPPVLVQWPDLPPTVVRDDIGGVIMEYAAHWQDLAATGDEVDILGPCLSACTLVTAYIPKDKLCFGENAFLQFHAARELNGEKSLWATKWMFNKYPVDIQRWLLRYWGSPEDMTIREWWTLPASDLWKMGYKRCHA
jgi:hypothetical protein